MTTRIPGNVFYLNLSCVYSFCFVLFNFTCRRVAVCLSMFLLIKLFQTYNKALYDSDPADMITGYPDPGPDEKWHPAVP